MFNTKVSFLDDINEAERRIRKDRMNLMMDEKAKGNKVFFRGCELYVNGKAYNLKDFSGQAKTLPKETNYMINEAILKPAKSKVDTVEKQYTNEGTFSDPSKQVKVKDDNQLETENGYKNISDADLAGIFNGKQKELDELFRNLNNKLQTLSKTKSSYLKERNGWSR